MTLIAKRLTVFEKDVIGAGEMEEDVDCIAYKHKSMLNKCKDVNDFIL
jgi:hypothetical protein